MGNLYAEADKAFNSRRVLQPHQQHEDTMEARKKGSYIKPDILGGIYI